MLTPKELKNIPISVVKIYEQLEEDILADIAKRLAKVGKITDTAEWQVFMLNLMGKDLKTVEKNIQKYNVMGKKELKKVFWQAMDTSMYRENMIASRAGRKPFDLKNSPTMQQFIKANLNKTLGNLDDFTGSLGFKDNKAFKTVRKQYIDTLNYAQFQISSGAFDYNTVIKQSIKKLADSGLRTVIYDTGAQNQLDVAVRRATMTGINQTVAEITLMNMDFFENDYVETTAHAGARPDHIPWQGRIFHIGGAKGKYPDFVSSTGYGTVTGLCGANCRHSFNSFYPDISERNYTDEELKHIDPPPFEYNGKTYTYYDATQRQRYIERNIRKTKRELIMYDNANMQDEFTASSVRLARLKNEYERFSDRANLPIRNELMQVYKFDRSLSKKSYWSVLKNSAKNDDIFNIDINKYNNDVWRLCGAKGIEYKQLTKSKKIKDTLGIIKELGGADRTEGSCSSLALAYAGNKAGYDVYDFRGGISRRVFATKGNIKEIANLKGVNGVVIAHKNDFTGAKQLLKHVEENKEYYFVTGCHASIIRKRNGIFEYLELQSTDNRFKELTGERLKNRFGCQKSHTFMGMKYETYNVLIDIDNLKNNKEFLDLLGFINTDVKKQLKGVGGYAK